MGCTTNKASESNPSTAPPAEEATKKSTPNPPIAFAIMRNSHESIRMSIKHVLSTHMESGDSVKFKAAWVDFQRAMAVHMEMEDKDMFPLLNSVSDNKCIEEHLDQEHVQDSSLAAAVSDELKFRNSVSTATFEAWCEHILRHLEHEEKVMMPLTAKTGATPEDRAKAVYSKLVTPAYIRNKNEFLWYLGWCLSQLSTHGSTANTAAVATRVFSHALQATSNASQWKEILPVVKANVSTEQWSEMVKEYYIDEGGKQQ